MAHHEIIPHHSNGDVTAAHAIVNIAMEAEGESRPPYWDVRKFHNDEFGS
jgi:hypothetical protein